MKFFGIKRVIRVDANYVQFAELGKFWNEIKELYPNENFVGMATNWVNGGMDYYIGKIDDVWHEGLEDVDLPDDGWEVFTCKDSDVEIEKMYRSIYKKGHLDYEIEDIHEGIFTTKVHFRD